MNAIAITTVLDKGVAEFRRALPEHVPVERFKRVAQTAILNSPILMRADPRALLTELVKAAQDGLLPDGREAAIVPTAGGVSYRPMVAGILKKARNSGEIAGISCEVAYKGEKFAVVLGDEPRITHERDLDAADGAPWVAVYAVATLKSGEKVRAVMTKQQVWKIRDRSDAYRAYKAGRIKSTPWDTDPEEMAKKTVIKRLAKLLPSSTDKDEALRRTIEREDDTHTIDAALEPEAAAEPATDRMAALEAAVVQEDDGPPDDGWPGPDVPAPTENVSQKELMDLAQEPAPVRGRGK